MKRNFEPSVVSFACVDAPLPWHSPQSCTAALFLMQGCGRASMKSHGVFIFVDHELPSESHEWLLKSSTIVDVKSWRRRSRSQSSSSSNRQCHPRRTSVASPASSSLKSPVVFIVHLIIMSSMSLPPSSFIVNQSSSLYIKSSLSFGRYIIIIIWLLLIRNIGSYI